MNGAKTCKCSFNVMVKAEKHDLHRYLRQYGAICHSIIYATFKADLFMRNVANDFFMTNL